MGEMSREIDGRIRRCVRSRTKGAPLARSRSNRETVRPWWRASSWHATVGLDEGRGEWRHIGGAWGVCGKGRGWRWAAEGERWAVGGHSP